MGNSPVLDHVVEEAAAVLGCQGAGVALTRGGELLFVAGTGGGTHELQALKRRAGEGPCFEAWRNGEVVATSSLLDSDRWPALASQAENQEFVAAADVPIVFHETVIGTLGLYWTSHHEFGAEEAEVAVLLAGMAAGYVGNCPVVTGAGGINLVPADHAPWSGLQPEHPGPDGVADQEDHPAGRELAARRGQAQETLERVKEANQGLIEALREAHGRIRALQERSRELRADNRQLRDELPDVDHEAGS